MKTKPTPEQETALGELENLIYRELSTAFQNKLRELPPPPPGYYYFPEYDHLEVVDGKLEITMTIKTKPIVSE